MGKKDLKLISPFLIFIIGGITGVHSVTYLTDELTFDLTFKWLTIPVLLVAGFYAYSVTFRYNNKLPWWKKFITMLVFTFISSMLFFVSSQGYLIRINNNFGLQKDYLLEGEIIELDYPEIKKIGNKYYIKILRKRENDTIRLSVPTDEYAIGQEFKKEMKIGSLGFVYSE